MGFYILLPNDTRWNLSNVCFTNFILLQTKSSASQSTGWYKELREQREPDLQTYDSPK